MNDAARNWPGETVRRSHGWWQAHRWLVARRLVQLLVVVAFWVGPWTGFWLVRGNLSASLTLDWLPLTDPFVLMQSLLAGHRPELTAIIGAVLVVVLYALLGGRAFCSWVCPVNVVADSAAGIRRRLGWKKNWHMGRGARRWMLLGVVLSSLVSGELLWEWVNPVGMTQRAVLAGAASGLWMTAWVFVLDLFAGEQSWCGHLCPQGQFYALLGRSGRGLAVAATGRERCDDCMDCFHVCPEMAVIKPALKGRGSPVIDSEQCTRCGRCLDVCSQSVFEYRFRFSRDIQVEAKS
jgi:ferredoxin-type protein NapH